MHLSIAAMFTEGNGTGNMERYFIMFLYYGNINVLRMET